jgi:hypothetical protein
MCKFNGYILTEKLRQVRPQGREKANLGAWVTYGDCVEVFANFLREYDPTFNVKKFKENVLRR